MKAERNYIQLAPAMASDAQAIARAFAPFAAIEEFQNVVALHNKRTVRSVDFKYSYCLTLCKKQTQNPHLPPPPPPG